MSLKEEYFFFWFLPFYIYIYIYIPSIPDILSQKGKEKKRFFFFILVHFGCDIIGGVLKTPEKKLYIVRAEKRGFLETKKKKKKRSIPINFEVCAKHKPGMPIVDYS